MLRKQKRITVLAIQCPSCKDILFSRARYDFRVCGCWDEEKGLGCSIDGGFEPAQTINGVAGSFVLSIPLAPGALYADWQKRSNLYGRYPKGALPKSFKIVRPRKKVSCVVY